MIDPLLPEKPAVPAKPAVVRTPATTPFEDWLTDARPAPEPTDMGEENLAANLPVIAAAEVDGVVVAPEPGVAVFEFHVLSEAGAVEMVSVPWRLAGNGVLSYGVSDPHPLTTAQLLQFHNAGATNATAATSAAPPAVGTAGSMALPGLIAPTPMVFAASTPTRPASPASAELAGSALPASLAEPWLARLLRWFERQGRDPVVWIRDYSLSDAASQAVVNEVRTMAREQGWHLQRIVLNGREMWSAPLTAHPQEKPSCP